MVGELHLNKAGERERAWIGDVKNNRICFKVTGSFN